MIQNLKINLCIYFCPFTQNREINFTLPSLGYFETQKTKLGFEK